MSRHRIFSSSVSKFVSYRKESYRLKNLP